MKEHYNLYYIFLEDKEENPLDEIKKHEMRETLVKRFEEKRGSTSSLPP